MRVLVFLFVVLIATQPLAQTGIEPDDIRIELALEPLPHAPHPGEMILLSIHGTYKIPVVREMLEQPALEGFDWMQLGEDRWYKEREDGFEVLKLERRMALFPNRTGTVTIPAFTHALEMLARNGDTVPVRVDSDEVQIEIQPRPETSDWWFPVRDLEISDRWSNSPEALDTGAAALRIVTLTVDGSAPQQIPPMPELTGASVFIFPHPEQKITALGPNGPMTRVFWRWTVRPHHDSAGYLNPVRVAWFDAQTRQHRDVSLSAQRIAYAEGAQVVASSKSTAVGSSMTTTQGTWLLPQLPGWSVPVAGAIGLMVGFGWALCSMGSGRWRLPIWIIGDPSKAALRRAVRAGDPMATRNAAHRLLGTQATDISGPLAKLDEALFGVEASMPDLKGVAKSVQTARRRP